jgi:hypothetical protein
MNAQLPETDLTTEIRFSAFGVRISIKAEDPKMLSKIRENLPLLIPTSLDLSYQKEVEIRYVLQSPNGLFEFYENDELIVDGGIDEKSFVNYFLSCLRLKVAENAVARVFIHAGVVGWNDKAIVIPADSYGGKTTLVSKLIASGAAYYSDEYAVFDENGFVHPYPKTLSVRGIIDDDVQKEIPAVEFGGVLGSTPIPVGLVLFTRFEQDTCWQMEELSTSHGVLKILAHTIPIRRDPKFALGVLSKALGSATILSGSRGEADKAVNEIKKLIFDQVA